MIISRNWTLAVALLTGLELIAGASLQAGGDRPLKSSPYDPEAKAVGLFSGLEEGVISVKVVAKGAEGGALFLTNKTTEPLTVKMPSGFVGVPVKPQFGAGAGGIPFGQNQGMGTGAGNAITAATGTQAIGGGTVGNTSANQNGPGASGNAFPQGFFSIPAEKTLRVPYTSVCLNHGLNEPTSRTHVQLVPVEEYTADPVLQALINDVGSGEHDRRSLQAAVWHIANGMSWQQLAEKGTSPVRIPGDNFFSASQMKAAKTLVKEVQEQVGSASNTAVATTTGSSVRPKLTGK
ncbi:hypothetical protein SH661x_002204 [Planctomicrobium sp. SH661]|uniref:hypothetical protein n=1 Tax=Planctomicrobium sp. SH661 TaxID=3448124 RepID=UPI003F5BB312